MEKPFKRPVQVHEAERAFSPANPVTNDRDYLVFVRDEANLAFRMMRMADQLVAYLGRDSQNQLVEDVLAKGVEHVKAAANCRR